MKANLSATRIRSLKPRNTAWEIQDTKIPGLLIRIQPSGRMNWYLQYARARRVRLGAVASLSTAQARTLAAEKLAGTMRGEDPRRNSQDKSLTLGAFVEDIYRPWSEMHHVRPQTNMRRLRNRFRALTRKRLEDISVYQVERWRTGRLREGRSPVTVNRDTDALKAVMNKARAWGYIDHNPLAELRRLRVDRSPRVRYLSIEEEAHLRNALCAREERIRKERDNANRWRSERHYPLLPDLRERIFADHLRPMVLVSLNTGMRQGELFSLGWEDVDLSRELITVGGESAKSGQTRYLPLNAEALETLRAWRAQAIDTEGLVFPSPSGKRFNNVQKSWHGVLQAADIKRFRWHDLRHHFASKLVMSGVDLNTVRELLGHATYQMTLRYAHLAPDHKAEAVARLISSDARTNISLAAAKPVRNIISLREEAQRVADKVG